MIQEHHYDFTKEIQIAVEKYALLSDIQLCEKIASMKNINDNPGTIEGMEALMMRLTVMRKKALNSLMKYAEIRLEEGNIGFVAVLNVFAVKELCNM